MKHLIFIFCTLVALPIYSQTGYYLHPAIEYKFDTNRNVPFDITTPQNYTIHIEPRNFTAEKTVFPGLQLGYRSKYWFFETGWGMDKFASGITLSGTVYDADKKSYYTKERKHYGGAALNKIPLRFGIRLFGKDSVATGKKLRCQFFIFGSIDFLISKPEAPATNDEFQINPQGDVVSYSYHPGRSFGIQTKKTIGLMLKTYTKKGNNINFSISYLPSFLGDLFFSSHYASSIYFTNYDNTTYHYTTSSFGSGFYIGLSTDLYTKNWFKKKQDVDYYR